MQMDFSSWTPFVEQTNIDQVNTQRVAEMVTIVIEM